MITAYIILGVVLAFPLVLGVLMRVNASHLFFSLLAGELLVRYFGDDAELAIRMISPNDNLAQYAELALLVIPMVLTAIFLRHSLSKGKSIFNIFPLAVMGFVFAAFALPLLPPDVQDLLKTTNYGQRILEGSDVIVGAVVLLQLVTLWLMNRPAHEGRKKKH